MTTTWTTRTRIFLFWFLPLAVALVSWRFIPLGVEASMNFMAHHLEGRALALYAHIGIAPLVLALVPFQVSPRLRAWWPALHRWTGRAYALGVLVSGVAALSLAAHSSAGRVAGLGFGLLGLLWIAITAQAVRLAMLRRIAAHRVWMIRSAALTLAAVTLRLELPILVGVLGFEQGYPIVAWSCWVPNLIVAEWIIRRQQKGALRA
ncbi:DUF2306 domain-containing protein [Marinovum algicola]|uniref:DUF2306 domain-containing protein n=1 Tax=Marinovum algicola TaxID=42444 RepID=UPI0024BA9AD7|nr:DUF2306 domain-containing protein [Marinovum algicola]